MKCLDTEKVECSNCDSEGGHSHACGACAGFGCGGCRGKGEVGEVCEDCAGEGEIEYDIIYLNISYKKAQELKDQGVFSGHSSASLEADEIQWFEDHAEDWVDDFPSSPNPGTSVVIALKYINFEDHLTLKEQGYKFTCPFEHDDILWALYTNDQGDHCEFQL